MKMNAWVILVCSGLSAVSAMASEEVSFDADVWINRCAIVRNEAGQAVGENCEFPQAHPHQRAQFSLESTGRGHSYGVFQLPVITQNGYAFQASVTVTKFENEDVVPSRRYLVQMWVRSAPEGEDLPVGFEHLASAFTGSIEQLNELSVTGTTVRTHDFTLSPWMFLGPMRE